VTYHRHQRLNGCFAIQKVVFKVEDFCFGEKFQIANKKQQTNPNDQSSKFQIIGFLILFVIWILQFGIYLCFGACISVFGIV
jgi:hypothetical protein